jgi:hypothetical protein
MGISYHSLCRIDLLLSTSVVPMESSFTSSSTKPLYRGTQIVWYVLGIVEGLLAIRFILKFLGANPEATFTSLIYALTYPFATPFLGVFGITRIVGSTIEWTTLLAMLVYWLLALAILKLFVMGRTVSTPEAAVKLEEQDS